MAGFLLVPGLAGLARDCFVPVMGQRRFEKWVNIRSTYFQFYNVFRENKAFPWFFGSFLPWLIPGRRTIGAAPLALGCRLTPLSLGRTTSFFRGVRIKPVPYSPDICYKEKPM